MEFEWDAAKSEANRARRGFGFDTALRVFEDRTVQQQDTRHVELRVEAVGVVEGVFLTVVYSDRGAVRRIISARPSSRKERIRWSR